MGSYGRNFEFRVPPVHGQRGGRYVLGGEDKVAIGAPVVVDTDGVDHSDRKVVELATGASAPVKGLAGVLVYEDDSALAGYDPLLTSHSDIDTAPAGKSVQVVSGDMVKIVFKNTEARKFLGVRDYKGRTMVDGDVAVGDYLTPGAGDDTDGYWAVTTDKNQAWLVVEGVDALRNEVEARFVF